MIFGIADISIIPLRREQSERSEMVSQLLFGETYVLLREEQNWIYIRTLQDQYEGWIDKKMFCEVSEDFIKACSTENRIQSKELFNIVEQENVYGQKLVVMGSLFPMYNKENHSFYIGENQYRVLTPIGDPQSLPLRTLLVDYALKYYNTPYLWGGRTPYGIDCSGLVQMVYSMVGIQLPRDASEQVNEGTLVNELEDCHMGDLAFFGEDKITHVGIIGQDGQIIHSSGKVRIDTLDDKGIYNKKSETYTHTLRRVKRIITD